MLERAMEALATEGYAVVKVLEEWECAALIDDMWAWMTSLGTGLKREDDATWTHAWPGHLHGIFKCHGVGQAPFMWKLRTHPKILDIFSHLWQTPPEVLLSSFDGCSVMRPRKYWRAKWGLSGRLHVDLSMERDAARRGRLSAMNRVGTPCVQGLVTLSDMDASTGTFGCIPGSHHRFRNRAAKPADWYILSDEDLEALGPPRRLEVPRGHLVLWDSKLAHCGAKPTPSDNEDRLRYVGYVSYLPRMLATRLELEKRRRAFEDDRTCSHWAYPVKMNAKRIRFDDKNYDVEIPPLSSYLNAAQVKLARRLVGY